MIVVMKPDATTAHIEHMAIHIAALGLTPQVIQGTHQTVIAALGEERPGLTEVLEPGEGVEKVLPIMAPYKRASSELKRDRTVVRAFARAGGWRHACGRDRWAMLGRERGANRGAGATAQDDGGNRPAGRGLQAANEPVQFPGAQGARPQNAWQPRGRGDWAGDRLTEVMAPSEHVSIVAQYADVLQIGARNMQNYQLLQAVGDSGKPALLKRGMSATVDEFLLAAEYILDRNNPNVMLCERGIRTYEDHTRFTLPLATVPYLHDKSHLPVVVDPSHGTGKARLVTPMAKAAVAAGADALIIEVHADPEHAVSDGAQTITPAAFKQLIDQCRRIAEAVDRTI